MSDMWYRAYLAVAAQFDALTAERDVLRAKLATEQGIKCEALRILEHVTMERDALRAQLDEACEALEPFAAAEVYCGSQNTDPDDEVVKWLFAIGHIRRARFVLKMIKGGRDE